VETNVHADADVACSLEDNNRLFSEERERLEKWAEDMVFAAEKELADTKAQIKSHPSPVSIGDDVGRAE
jgi:hypothetical protein